MWRARPDIVDLNLDKAEEPFHPKYIVRTGPASPIIFLPGWHFPLRGPRLTNVALRSWPCGSLALQEKHRTRIVHCYRNG